MPLAGDASADGIFLVGEPDFVAVSRVAHLIGVVGGLANDGVVGFSTSTSVLRKHAFVEWRVKESRVEERIV